MRKIKFILLVAITVIPLYVALAQHNGEQKAPPQHKGMDEARSTLAKAKADLMKKGQYACCIQPGCDICPLSANMCPCAGNLLQKKPVCGECFAGWHAGQGALAGVKVEQVKAGPIEMAVMMRKMRAQMEKASGAKKASSEASSQKSERSDEGKMSLAKLKIEGLHCYACVERTTNILKSVKGVISAQVDLDSGEAVVKFDPQLTNIEALVEAINKSGEFKAKAV